MASIDPNMNPPLDNKPIVELGHNFLKMEDFCLIFRTSLRKYIKAASFQNSAPL